MQIVDIGSKRRVGTGRVQLAVGVPAVVVLVLTATVLSACSTPRAPGLKVGTPAAANVTLVRFNSCADALQHLRSAANRALGSAGLATGTGSVVQGSGGVAGAGAAAAPAFGAEKASGTNPTAVSQAGSAAAPGSYSTTNTATAGVDEPDIVKTDGVRIVSITGDVLRVIDAQTRQITGALDLSSISASRPPYVPGPVFAGMRPANLLLFGNHALVLFNQSPYVIEGLHTGVSAIGSAASGNAIPNAPFFGPQLVLVDLSTRTPRIISEFTMDGSLVDARQVGSVARVVVQSAPRFYSPPFEVPGAGAGLAPQRAAIANAGLSQWLPHYAVTTGGRQQSGMVDCASVSHPAEVAYSGTSMLTVLTFDLGGASLGAGEPVTIVADGDTVYSDGASLYIASRQSAEVPVMRMASAAPPVVGASSSGTSVTATAAPPTTVPQYTAIYKFDISGPGRPVYEAAGTVPGWLLGSSDTAEYSLSAWNGALRVATTTYGSFALGAEQQSQSAVYVLDQTGTQLFIVGKVGGLGNGEQIYAVRFVGPVGYVVTFRQTDPLYTLDLSDPAQPRVAGQLLLSGYSAYLYPIDATHLIGIGQDANALGQTTGTQVSLFDVSDPAAPVRLAAYDLQFGHSEAEFDPHAFLYWPGSRLLVIPVQLPDVTTPLVPPTPLPQGGVGQGGTASSGSSTGGPVSGGASAGGPGKATEPAFWPQTEAIALHVGDSGFTELGTITHPDTHADPAGGQIVRSLIVGNELWTLSDAGLKANDMATLAPLAWVPF